MLVEDWFVQSASDREYTIPDLNDVESARLSTNVYHLKITLSKARVDLQGVWSDIPVDRVICIMSPAVVSPQTAHQNMC